MGSLWDQNGNYCRYSGPTLGFIHENFYLPFFPFVGPWVSYLIIDALIFCSYLTTAGLGLVTSSSSPFLLFLGPQLESAGFPHVVKG